MPSLQTRPVIEQSECATADLQSLLPAKDQHTPHPVLADPEIMELPSSLGHGSPRERGAAATKSGRPLGSSHFQEWGGMKLP